MFEFQCPHCSMTMRVADQIAGKAWKCKGCGREVTVPRTPTENPTRVPTATPTRTPTRNQARTPTATGPAMEKAERKPDLVGRFVTITGFCAIMVVLAGGMYMPAINGPRARDQFRLLTTGVFLAPVVAFVGIYWLLKLLQIVKDPSWRFAISAVISTLIFILGCGGLALRILKALGESLA